MCGLLLHDGQEKPNLAAHTSRLRARECRAVRGADRAWVQASAPSLFASCYDNKPRRAPLIIIDPNPNGAGAHVVQLPDIFQSQYDTHARSAGTAQTQLLTAMSGAHAGTAGAHIIMRHSYGCERARRTVPYNR
jgi:hypothetical protein